jgi:hypothetical protein
MTEKHKQDDVSRRDFFKSATAATVATSSVLLLKPESALGAAADTALCASPRVTGWNLKSVS